MLLGQYQTQIFIGAIVLGLALIAVICDRLRSHNEQLRQKALELDLRNRMLEAKVRLCPEQASVHAPPQVGVKPPFEKPVRQLTAPATTEEKRLTRVVRHASSSSDQTRIIASDAMKALTRGAELAAAPRPPVVKKQSLALAQPAMKQLAAAAPTGENVGPTLSLTVRRDWASLLQASRHYAAASDLPFGFQDGYVLTRLIENHQPVSGLVVSINVSAPVTASVRSMVQSLIGPSDFAAQSGDDSFLLIYPREHGASAQLRLNKLTQQLGAGSILCSWRGVEVRSQSIEAAIASASGLRRAA